MAAGRHEPACVTEKLMTMIDAAAAPSCNERFGADEGSSVWGRRRGLGLFRRRHTETQPKKEHVMRMGKQSTWYAYGQAWTKPTYRIQHFGDDGETC